MLREKPFDKLYILRFFAIKKKRQTKKYTIMKKLMTALTVFFTLTVTANAMSYSQAREQALFLTDKMAYELNLTQEQYDAAYEVNLDYLMSINNYDDLYGTYWRNRNIDLGYILLDWQYRAYCAASYFYRPLYWTSGVWHFAIYSRYPHRHYYYFGRPNIYVTYRGGHGWHHNGGHSWYKGRTFNHGGISRGHGMKDRFDRGDFHRGGNRGKGFTENKHNGGYNNNNSSQNRNDRNGGFSGHRGTGNSKNDNNKVDKGSTSGNSKFNGYQGRYNRDNNGLGQNRGNFRNNRESSTRTTARTSTETRHTNFSGNTTVSGNRTTTMPSRTFTPSHERSSSIFNRGSNSGSFSSRSSSYGSGSRSFGSGNRSSNSGSSSRSSSGGSKHGGSFGGRR